MYFLQNICSNAISVDRNSKNVLQIKKKGPPLDAL